MKFIGPRNLLEPPIKLSMDINEELKYTDCEANKTLFTEPNDFLKREEKILGQKTDQTDRNLSSTKIKKKNRQPNTNFLRLIKTLKDSVSSIRKLIFFKNFLNMTPHQRNLLNDISYFENSDLKNNGKYCFKKFFSIDGCINHIKILQIFNLKILNPGSPLKRLWNFLLVILTFLNFFIYSLDFSLLLVFSYTNNQYYKTASTHTLTILNLIIYFIDFVISLNTGYIERGNLIMDRNQIHKNYLKKYVILDILSYVALMTTYFEFFKLGILFFFCRYRKFSARVKDFQEFLIQEKEEFDDYLSILLLYCKTFFISHLMGCLWFVIGHLDIEKGWLSTYQNEDWMTKYLNSIYLSLVTMLTVGYGDLTPQTDLEKIICIIVMLVGFTVFGFTLGSICDIIQKMNAKSQELKLMKKNNVGMEFQTRVRKYIEYIFQEESDKKKEDELLKKLSKSLKNEFYYEVYKKNFLDLPCFKLNFSNECVMALSHIIKKIDFPPEETILNNDDQTNSNFYYIFKGRAIMSYTDIEDSTRKNSIILKEHNTFNEIRFFSNTIKDKYSIKTDSFCTFYVLNRLEFINLLKNDFPEDYEKYFLIMSKIKYQKNISVLNLKCYSCFSKDHQMGECPFLHYIPNKKKIIALHNHNNMIENRKSFKRSNRKYNYKNCRLIRNEVEKSTKNFIDDFENIQSFINSFDSISDEEDLELNSNENDLNHLHHLNNFIGTKEELEFNFKEKENNKKDIKLKKKTSKQFEEKIHKEQEIVQFDEKIKKFHENSEDSFNQSKIKKKLSKNFTRTERTNSNLFKESFEPKFIHFLLFYRKIFRIKLENLYDDNYDLYSFDFDKANNYKFFYPQHNYAKQIQSFKKFSIRKLMNKIKTRESKRLKKSIFAIS